MEDVMRFGGFKFGSIQIDGVTYKYDVVIDGGSIRKRTNKPSKPFRSSVATHRFPLRTTFPGIAGGWTPRGIVVERVPVAADGAARFALDEDKGAIRSALVIAPTAARTLVPANYSITIYSSE
jgi:hypothetical protein